LALALTFGLAAAVKAQTAPAPDQTPETQSQVANEEPVVLSTFIVDTSTDKGYVAVNSLAGGRNNTPLAITPTSVSSLTAVFLDDLQLTNATDALKWTMNAIPQNMTPNVGSGNEFNSWATDLRSAGNNPQGGTAPTVNYFPIYAIKDFFNVDRFEIDLGPNSILFGVGSIGGTVASYTKKPRFDQNFTEADLLVNSFGGVRLTFDVNQRLSILKKDDLAIRINLLGDHDETWRKADLIKRWGVSEATTFKVSNNTSVRFDAEIYEAILPQYAENLQDHYSQWDGKTASQTWGAVPTGGTTYNPNGMSEWSGPFNPFFLWIPSEGTLANWSAGYNGVGLADAPYYSNAELRPSPYTLVGTNQTVPALPSRDFTIGPSNGNNTLKYYTLTAYIDQRINEHSEFELSAYRFSDSEISQFFESPGNISVDINKQLPNGAPNPEFGQLYTDMFLDKQVQDHSVNEFRGQFNYHFDTNVFNVPLKEWLSVSGGYSFHLLLTRQYIDSFLDNYPANWNTGPWTQNMIWAREYFDHPNDAINLPSSFDGHPIGFQALGFNWFDHDLAEEIKYFGAVSQTRLWDDRLNVTLGARHDEYSNDLLQSVRPPYGLPYPQGHSFESDNGTTYSAGIVGFITKEIAATYNYSSNFAPNANGVSPSLSGTQFGPAKGKGNEFGLRFSTDDGKYYVTASYYQDVSSGRITNDTIPIQSIWNDYFNAGGTATDIGPAGHLSGVPGNYATQFNYADTEDLKDTGYEISAVANPTPNWKIQINYSQPKSVSTNDMPGSRAYFAAHLTEWSSVASGGTALDGTLKQDLANAELELNNTAVSATTQGEVKSTFNVVAAYSFTDTWAKGLTIGAGATALGEQETSTGGSFFSPAYTTYIAFVKYQTVYELGGKKWHVTYQLNVDNLTDNKNLVFTGYNQNGSAIQGSNYYFLEPRKFSLSVQTKF
jgi:hypothetical protein